jgi:hypothetical protein
MIIEAKTYKKEYAVRDFKWDAKKKTLILGDVHDYGYLPAFIWITGDKHRVYFEHMHDNDTAQVAIYKAPYDASKDIDFNIRVLIPWVRK